MFGKQVGQFDVQCLSDGEDAAQPGVCRGVRVRFPSFKLPVGEAREARFGRDPVSWEYPLAVRALAMLMPSSRA